MIELNFWFPTSFPTKCAVKTGKRSRNSGCLGLLYKSNFDLDLSEEKIDEFLKKKGLKIYSYYIDTWKEKNDFFQFFLRVIWIN